MDRTDIRAWRRIQKKRVWRNRLRIIFRAFSKSSLENAESWKELRKLKWCQAYRTTGQPCSCMMCSGERFNRNDSKREAQKLLSEQLDRE